MLLMVIFFAIPALLVIGLMCFAASCIPKLCIIFATIFWMSIIVGVLSFILGSAIALVKRDVSFLAFALWIGGRVCICGLLLAAIILIMALVAEWMRSFVDFISGGSNFETLTVGRLFIPWRY